MSAECAAVQVATVGCVEGNRCKNCMMGIEKLKIVLVNQLLSLSGTFFLLVTVVVLALALALALKLGFCCKLRPKHLPLTICDSIQG